MTYALAPLTTAFTQIEDLRLFLRTQVMGRDDVIDLMLIGLISGGHILLEDFPGSGKTTLAKALGQTIDATSSTDGLTSFRRLQFTPDLLPSDITGVMIFDPNKGEFHLRKGPIFAHVVLVDEINRTSPKVQSALLESMAERQVTIDNETYPLDPLFLVIATQNPSDSVGTYPLPQAQLDRFLFKISMTHIDATSELAVLRKYGQNQHNEVPNFSITREQLLDVRKSMHEHIVLSEAIEECLVAIAHQSRIHPDVSLGLSTRTIVNAVGALKAKALLSKRDFVKPEDLVDLAYPLFQHRLIVRGGSDRVKTIIDEMIKSPLNNLIKKGLGS